MSSSARETELSEIPDLISKVLRDPVAEEPSPLSEPSVGAAGAPAATPSASAELPTQTSSSSSSNSPNNNNNNNPTRDSEETQSPGSQSLESRSPYPIPPGGESVAVVPGEWCDNCGAWYAQVAHSGGGAPAVTLVGTRGRRASIADGTAGRKCGTPARGTLGSDDSRLHCAHCAVQRPGALPQDCTCEYFATLGSGSGTADGKRSIAVETGPTKRYDAMAKLAAELEGSVAGGGTAAALARVVAVFERQVGILRETHAEGAPVTKFFLEGLGLVDEVLGASLPGNTTVWDVFQDIIFSVGGRDHNEMVIVSFGRNLITRLPGPFRRPTRISWLFLDNCRIREVPAEVLEATQLTHLSLCNNSIERIPAEIGALKRVEVLYLSTNCLSSLPREIGDLSCLKELYLHDNLLREIPYLGNLGNLTILELSYNRFETFPIEFRPHKPGDQGGPGYSSLRELYLNGNRDLLKAAGDNQGARTDGKDITADNQRQTGNAVVAAASAAAARIGSAGISDSIAGASGGKGKGGRRGGAIVPREIAAVCKDLVRFELDLNKRPGDVALTMSKYVDFNMVQKRLVVSKEGDWLRRGLEQGGEFDSYGANRGDNDDPSVGVGGVGSQQSDAARGRGRTTKPKGDGAGGGKDGGGGGGGDEDLVRYIDPSLYYLLTSLGVSVSITDELYDVFKTRRMGHGLHYCANRPADDPNGEHMNALVLIAHRVLKKNVKNLRAAIAEEDQERRTPLHVACETNNYEVAALLVAHGADTMALDSSGRSPAEYIGRRALFRYRHQHPFFGGKIATLFRERTRLATSEYALLVDAGINPTNYGVYGFPGDVCSVYRECRQAATGRFVQVIRRYLGDPPHDGSERESQQCMGNVAPLLPLLVPRAPPQAAVNPVAHSSAYASNGRRGSRRGSGMSGHGGGNGSAGAAAAGSHHAAADGAARPKRSKSSAAERVPRRSEVARHTPGFSEELAVRMLEDWESTLSFFADVVQTARGGGKSADRYQVLSLQVAAIKGDAESIATLVNAGSVYEYVDNRGKTALHYAAHFGFSAVIEELVEEVGRVFSATAANAGNGDGTSAGEGKGAGDHDDGSSTKGAAGIKGAGDNANSAVNDNNGNDDNDNGANDNDGYALFDWINSVDDDGYPALFYAIRGGHIAAAEALLKAGAATQFDDRADGARGKQPPGFVEQLAHGHPKHPDGNRDDAVEEEQWFPPPLTAHETAIIVLANQRYMANRKRSEDKRWAGRGGKQAEEPQYTPSMALNGTQTLSELYPRVNPSTYEDGLEVAERMVSLLIEEDDVKAERRKAALRSFFATFLPYLIMLVLVTLGAAWSRGLVPNDVSPFTVRTGIRTSLSLNDGGAFYDIGSFASVHDYLEGTVATVLFPDAGPEGGNPPAALTPDSGDLGRTMNLQHNVLVGALRLRTVRTGATSCHVPGALLGYVTGRECFARYSPDAEDRSSYGINGTVYTWSDPGGPAYVSAYDSSVRYGSGGYVVDLDPSDPAKSREAIGSLRTGGFVDRATRALFVDFWVGNPSARTITRVRMVAELPPEGGAIASDYVEMVNIASNAVPWLLHIGASVIMAVYMSAEVRDMRRYGSDYFRDFFNLFDLVNSLLFVAITVVKVVLLASGPASRFDLGAFASPPTFGSTAGFIDGDAFLALIAVHDNMSAIFVMLAWATVIKYAARLPGLGQVIAALIDTVTNSKVLFFILFSLSFVWSITLGSYLLLAHHSPPFATISLAMFSIVQAMVGEGWNEDLGGAAPWRVVTLQLIVIIVLNLLLINLFIAIVSESYAVASEHRGDVWNRNLTDTFVYYYAKSVRRQAHGLPIGRWWYARVSLQGYWVYFNPGTHPLSEFVVSDKAVASLNVERRLAATDPADIFLFQFLKDENVRSDGKFDHALDRFDEQAKDLRSVGKQGSLFRRGFFKPAGRK